MPRVLVVEDDKLINMMFEESLVQEGYQVEIAYDGQDGIRRHRNNPFDLIISDIVMPIKNGIEMITELRRTSPEVKILVVTSISDTAIQYGDILEKLAPIPMLHKPVTRDDLLAAVRQLLGA